MMPTSLRRLCSLAALVAAPLAVTCARGDAVADSASAAGLTAMPGDTAAERIAVAMQEARSSLTRLAFRMNDSTTTYTVVTSETDPARPAGAGLTVGQVHLATMMALGNQWCDERPAAWKLRFDYYTNAETRFGGRYATTCGEATDIISRFPVTLTEVMKVGHDTLMFDEPVVLPAITSRELATRMAESLAGLKPGCADRLCPGDTPPPK